MSNLETSELYQLMTDLVVSFALFAGTYFHAYEGLIASGLRKSFFSVLPSERLRSSLNYLAITVQKSRNLSEPPQAGFDFHFLFRAVRRVAKSNESGTEGQVRGLDQKELS